MTVQNHVRGPKLFTDADVISSAFRDGTPYHRISCDSSELVDDSVYAVKQTGDGYGRKLNTGRKINFNGKLYRLYATCFSNAASVWFVAKGRKIFVD